MGQNPEQFPAVNTLSSFQLLLLLFCFPWLEEGAHKKTQINSNCFSNRLYSQTESMLLKTVNRSHTQHKTISLSYRNRNYKTMQIHCSCTSICNQKKDNTRKSSTKQLRCQCNLLFTSTTQLLHSTVRNQVHCITHKNTTHFLIVKPWIPPHKKLFQLQKHSLSL